MRGIGRRSIAASAAFASAALFLGLGARLSTADEPKAPDLTDLRDAVKAASKRGDNVDEVAKALAALEAALAKGAAGPNRQAPPELVALRDAVEAAGRKGENVEAIRKELEAVEKAITGQVLSRPKPALPPLANPNARPRQPQPPDPFGGVLPEFPGFPLPDLGAGGLNPNDLKMAQDLLQKALGGGLNNPNNPDGIKDLQQALDAFRKMALLGEELGLPEFAQPQPQLGRIPDRARLGIRMERLTPVVVEQLGLERGQGVAIVAVVEGTPAEKAGLKANDILLEFGGKPVGDSPEDVARRVNEVKAGEKVDLVVMRKGKKVEVKGIELVGQPAGQRPAPRVPEFKPLPFPNVLPDVNPILPGGIPQLKPIKPGGVPD